MHHEKRLLAEVCFAHMVSHFHVMAVPALMPLLNDRADLSYIEIGVALTIFNLISLLVQPPLGFLTDRIGARRMLLAGLLLGGGSFAALSITTNNAMLIAAMITAGVANGVYHPADYALLSSEISQRRMGRAFSLHSFAGYLGTAIAPAALLTTAGLSGLPAAFALAALLGFGGAFAVMIGARRSRATNPVSSTCRGTPHASPTPFSMRVILSLIALFVLLSLGVGGIQNFSVAALALLYGLELRLTGAALTGFLFASALGVLAGGFLADRTERHGFLAAAALLGAAALVCVVATMPLPSAILIAVMSTAGFLTGVIVPSRDLLVKAAAPVGSEGRVFGIVSTGFNIGGAAGSAAFAWLMDSGHPRAIFLASAICLMAAVVLAIAQEVQIRRTCSAR